MEAFAAEKVHVRKRICEEVESIVRERVPSDDGAPGWAKLVKLRQASKDTVGGRGADSRDILTASGRAKTASRSGHTRHGSTQWADEFSARCAVRSAERAEERRRRELEIRSYRPKKVDFTMLQYQKLPPIQEPKDWQDSIWQRNRLCEFCVTIATAGSERVECRFCNVVAHARCALPSSTFKAQLWMCDDCIYSLEECRRRQIVAAADHQCLITQHIHATVIQGRIRMFVKRQPHLRLRRGMVLLQGAMRCHYARNLFREAFTNDERPYSIRLSGVSGLASYTGWSPAAKESDGQEYYVIVSIVPTDPEKPVRELSTTTIYQFNSQPRSRDEFGVVEFNENFLIPCTVCGVTVFLTLVSKPIGTPPNEVPQIAFHGQTSYDLEDDLLYFKKVVVDDEVEACLYEPREKPGFSPVIRMVNVDKGSQDSFSSTARITYEMTPCPNATTHHGSLDEVSSVFSRKAVKRKWWVLIVEDKIYFYRSQSNPVPVMAWPLWKIALKLHDQSGVIELKHADRTMLISHGDADQRYKWFSLVKQNSEAIRAKNSTNKRRRSSTVGKGRRRSSFSSASLGDLNAAEGKAASPRGPDALPDVNPKR